MNVTDFATKWASSAGAERANKDLFFTELCDALVIPRPNPVTGHPATDTYVFEKDVPFRHPDGRSSVRKIDVYKQGAFILEAKQGSTATSAKLGTARRETDAWNIAMQDALGQALGYARCIDDPPPFIVVADIGYCFDLYACFDRSSVWSPFPNAQHRRIYLADIEKHADTLRTVFTQPLKLDPTTRAAKVTRTVAAHLAELATLLEKTGLPQGNVARFLMRCLFTMFAEDVGLLPDRLFTRSLEGSWLRQPETFTSGLKQLWTTMNAGGDLYLVGKILRFNGGLFKEAEAIPLDRAGLLLLLEAAKCDWAQVEPAIFGTLLERALDPRERHRLGAHFTPRTYVERLVRPTLEEPIREEWDAVRSEVHYLLAKNIGKEGKTSPKNRSRAEKLVRNFHQRLCGLRVLDPACGSGNFLYVSLDLFMRIESEVLAVLNELGNKQELLGLTSIRVTPGQFLGLEVKPWAKEIADLVLWIGYLQWHFRAYASSRPVPDPVLSDYGNIECRDAVLAFDGTRPSIDPETGNVRTRWDGITTRIDPLTQSAVPDERAQTPLLTYEEPRVADWPKADFIIGNPPFLGNKRMRSALGDGYVDAIRTAHQDVPDTVDFVMYWWHMAAQRVARKETLRAGFITTNSITQPFNRAVVKDAITASPPVSLVFAIPNHPWVDASGAADVRIAMTALAAGSRPGRLAQVLDESQTQDEVPLVALDEKLGVIHADLRLGANLAATQRLDACRGLSFMGVTLSGKGFVVQNNDQAPLEPAALKPYLVGNELNRCPRNRRVIDFTGLSEDEARETYPHAFQRVLTKVKPVRATQNRAQYREKWWLFAEPRPAMRTAVHGLSRYIGICRTAKHFLFQFVPGDALVESTIIAIASDDAAVLALLSSRVHVTWATAQATRMGVGDHPRYNNTRCFETFAFPERDHPSFAALRSLGEQLEQHRKAVMLRHPKLKLTDVYNVLHAVRDGAPLSNKDRVLYETALVGVLGTIHDAINEAALAAYGLPVTADSEAIVDHLTLLNAERRAAELRGEVLWLRPDQQREQPATDDASEAEEEPEDAEDEEDGEDAPAAPRMAARPWPKTLPDQLGAARQALQDLTPGTAFTAKEFALRLHPAPEQDVASILDCLAAVGLVLRLESERGTTSKAYAAVG